MDKISSQRISLSIYFLLLGFCFATWASRIPSIKTNFNFDEAELGNLLLVMPISSLIGLPISGWLVSKFNSRIPLLASYMILCLSLVMIGFASDLEYLIIGVALFAFCTRIANISVNTQSITLQKQREKKIIGSFHGLWSLGGLAGALVSTLMVQAGVKMVDHFLYVSIFSLVLGVFSYPFLIAKDKSEIGNKLIIGKPDKYILYLGLMVFFGALCEGGMFDWSGVYFKEVVGEEIFTLGYLIFMAFMALSRFYSDRLTDRIGMPKTYILGASIVTIGMFLAIVFPFYWPVLIGFSLVGIGVAAVFPMTFSLAGSSKKYSPGMAISIISTYGIAGMLIGPPLVGYIAHVVGLQYAFVLFILSGLMLVPLSQLFFKLKSE
ncbi:MFS transporter [Lutimonas sp.]|jgi:MFS family permease|uniref:MFS transporter n=1 Tax=Lutimonas sp. TaxID=1872403 RepID=UPI003C794393